MSLIDILVILIVIALLVFASSKEFPRYSARVLSPPSTVTPQPSS